MTVSSEIRYRVNRHDEIVAVSDSWDAFALANEGDGAVAREVVGRPLWDFIRDTTTRELYRQMLASIRAGRTMRFTLRCDSPACRRLLEMDVTGEPDGGVAFCSRVVSEETRDPPVPVGPAEGSPLLRMCSWCNRVAVGRQWVEVEAALDGLQLMEQASPPGLTHGICEDCYHRMEHALA